MFLGIKEGNRYILMGEGKVPGFLHLLDDDYSFGGEREDGVLHGMGK